MPNWCANAVRITAATAAQKKKLEKIALSVATGDDKFKGLFESFIPVPKELQETTAGFSGDPEEQKVLEEKSKANKEKYGYDNWYDFCLGEWGSKWDANEVDGDIYGHTIYLTFDTAWSPPTAFYEYLTSKGYKVTGGFVEQGSDYIGYYTSEGGKYSVCFSEEVKKGFELKEGEEISDLDDYYDSQDLAIERFFEAEGIDTYPTWAGG